MDVLVALDILLGLSLVYLVFSLAITSLNECIAACLSSRARWLRKGIGSLLSVNPKKLDLPKADAVLDSPFVTYLGTTGILKTFRASYIPAWPLMQGILSTVEGAKEDAFAKVADICALAAKLPEKSPIRSILIDLCARAEGDLTKFREMLDAWFKTFEDQVSAWYRQKTQYVVVALSGFVVVAMNIDTIDLVRQLSADSNVRTAVVEQALVAAKAVTLDEYIDVKARDQAREAWASAVEQRKKVELCANQTPNDTGCKSGIEAEEENEAKRLDTLKDEQKKLDQRIKDRADALSNSGLKLGWDAEWSWKMIITSLTLQKVIGLLLSAFAVALGAPFWFDVLKSVASIRSVGANIRERKAAEPK